jgi:UDP-sulfoquinovose synthase
MFLTITITGHEVIMVDNLSRRKIDLELGCESLTPIQSAQTRIKVWAVHMHTYDLSYS